MMKFLYVWDLIEILSKKCCPDIRGYKGASIIRCNKLGFVHYFDIASGEFIQILHTGTDHWLCISSIGCSPVVVRLFDSFYNDVILTEVEEQTQDLLGGKQVDLVYFPVQQQTNGSDCGVFAIAFATCLAFDENPAHMTFDVPKMRPHLATCLKHKNISLFPHF